MAENNGIRRVERGAWREGKGRLGGNGKQAWWEGGFGERGGSDMLISVIKITPK